MYWVETINVGHLHRLYSDGKINVVALAKGVVARLKTIHYYATAEPDFMNVIMELNSIDAYSDYDDYIVALDFLLEFGDKNNRLWVETEKPTSKEDIDDDKKATNINVKMLDDYKNGAAELMSALVKGPYYKSRADDIVKASPATDNSPSTSCATNKYNRKKQIRFLSEYDFGLRLKAKGINPNDLSRDFSNYVRDADDPYQAWILDRFVENGGRSIDPKRAPVKNKKSMTSG